MEKNIIVGVNVFVFNKDGRILLGRRKGGSGDGEWCMPGGKLEFGESIYKGAVREVLEETGIQLGKIALVNITNDPRPDKDEHFVQFNFAGDTESDPKLIEPDKFFEWTWFDLDRLPLPFFYGHIKSMDAYKARELVSD